MTNFYVFSYIAAAVGGIVTAIATWWLCLIVKKGLDGHLAILQAIHEEVRRANQGGRDPGKP